jgi:predicted patatin/cPLA2 family phospholipase
MDEKLLTATISFTEKEKIITSLTGTIDSNSANVTYFSVEDKHIENEHQHNIRKKGKSGDFDTLVLSGGSIHAIIMLGALQYAEDNYLLKKINTFIGTSAGAMCCYLLGIGYTPIEIMVYLCTKQVLEKMKHFNIVAMMNGSGGTSYVHIQEQLEKMTIEKIGRLITLKELYTLFNKKLVCCTYNLTKNCEEILSHETHPDMPCLIALRMSSNLPFIFDHFKYTGSFYTDGGISNNFPIDIGDQIGTKILGLVLHKFNFDFKNKENTIEYIYQLMLIPVNQSILNKINKASEKCDIIKIETDKTPFFDFNLDTYTKLEMFSNGFVQMSEYWGK